jgi:UDP-glucose 4-epimerase
VKILVAGGAGFIGSHACDRLLALGHTVHALDNLSLGRIENIAHLLKVGPVGNLANIDHSRFRFIEADLLNFDSLRALFEAERYDAVFHLAANSDVRRSAVETNLDLRQTFLTTYNILECMRLAGTREILFASSSTVYGSREGALSEDAGPLRPVSLYGAAKLASEAYLSAFASLYGIRAWIFRLPNVVGARMTHGVIRDFIHRLREDPARLIVLGDGNQSKPYVLVDEVLDAMLLAWERSRERVNGFNIGVESATPVRTIAETVIAEMELENVAIEYTGGPAGWPGDVPRFRYDLARIHALGWRARRTSDEAVRLAARAHLAFITARAGSKEGSA